MNMWKQLGYKPVVNGQTSISVQCMLLVICRYDLTWTEPQYLLPLIIHKPGGWQFEVCSSHLVPWHLDLSNTGVPNNINNCYAALLLFLEWNPVDVMLYYYNWAFPHFDESEYLLWKSLYTVSASLKVAFKGVLDRNGTQFPENSTELCSYFEIVVTIGIAGHVTCRKKYIFLTHKHNSLYYSLSLVQYKHGIQFSNKEITTIKGWIWLCAKSIRMHC